MEENQEEKKEEDQKVLTHPLESYLLAGLLFFLVIISERKVPALL